LVEDTEKGPNDRPVLDCCIVDCGELAEGADDGVVVTLLTLLDLPTLLALLTLLTLLTLCRW
jgi:hypothetical protein